VLTVSNDTAKSQSIFLANTPSTHRFSSAQVLHVLNGRGSRRQSGFHRGREVSLNRARHIANASM
jgi:hypothetical protein